MNHCDDIRLERFINHGQNWTERFRCAVHILLCPVCRKKLRRMRDDHSFLHEFRQGVLVMENAHTKAQSIANGGKPKSVKPTLE